MNSYPVRYFTCQHPEDVPDINDPDSMAFSQIVYSQVMDEKLGEPCGDTGLGLKLDFNMGLRLDVPEGHWHIRIKDYDTETVFFDEAISCIRLISLEKYYIRWHIEAWKDGTMVFSHLFDPQDQLVIFYAVSQALGDNLAMLPHAKAFGRRFHCRTAFLTAEYLRPICSELYPEITQLEEFPEDAYATYYLGTWFTEASFMNPYDGHYCSLELIAGTVCGMPYPVPHNRYVPKHPPLIREPYVCIAVQASLTTKGWHYPQGWEIIVDWLKEQGWRVIAIDRDATCKTGELETSIPRNAEDFTGAIPLTKRAEMLYYADFMLGLSSGLAWLAQAVGCPAVVICGFSAPWHDFPNPYYVQNPLVCHNCLGDTGTDFIGTKACPRHQDTDRELECSKRITPLQVQQTVLRLLSDGLHKRPR